MGAVRISPVNPPLGSIGFRMGIDKFDTAIVVALLVRIRRKPPPDTNLSFYSETRVPPAQRGSTTNAKHEACPDTIQYLDLINYIQYIILVISQ